MIKEDSVNKTNKIRNISFMIFGFVYGIFIWVICGISPLGYYNVDRFDLNEVILRWFFLPVCIFFAIFQIFFTYSLLFKLNSWIRFLISSIIVLNISFFIFTFVNFLLINYQPQMCHWDNSLSTIILGNSAAFLRVLILINIIFLVISSTASIVFYALNKILKPKQLP